MTPDEGWHLTRPLLAEYANGRPPLARAASVEAHLTACDHCRAMLDGLLPDALIDRMWQRVTSTVYAPSTGRIRRAVEHLRARSTPTRFPTPTFRVRRTGFAAVALVLSLTLAGPQASPPCESNAGTAAAMRSESGQPGAMAVDATPARPDHSPTGYLYSPDAAPSLAGPGTPGTSEPEPGTGIATPGGPAKSPTPEVEQQPGGGGVLWRGGSRAV